MFDYEKRKYIVFGVLIIVMAFISGMKYSEYCNNTKVNNTVLLEDFAIPQNNTIEEAGEKDIEINNIKVYICGAVKQPMVYELQEGARLYEVLEMAELRENADYEAINMARILLDQEKIIVPVKGENNNFASMHSSNISIHDEIDTGSNCVNINTASAQELDDKLPGIGPTLAARIIQYRETRGRFSKAEDICNVSGIGEKRFIDIKDLISVR